MLDGPGALEGRQAGARPQIDAVLAVQAGVDRADLGPEHALERHLGLLHHCHLETRLSQRRGDLGADPAGTDDDRRGARRHALPDRLGVVEVAQVQDPVEVGPRHVEASGLGAGRQQKPVEPDLLPSVDDDLAGTHVDRGDGGGRSQLDVVRGVEALLVHVEYPARGLAL